MFVKNYYPTKRNNNTNLDNFFNDFFFDFDKNINGSVRKRFVKNRPAVNISEGDDGFQIEMAVPGLGKEDIKIDLDGNMLKVSGKKIEEKKEGFEKKYSLRQFNFSNFEKSFELPETVDNQKVSAKFENGILVLELPKKEEAKPVPPRAIAIL